MRTRNFLARLLRNDAGATAIEYGLIVSLVVIAILSSVQSVADKTSDLWTLVSEKAEEKMGG